MLIIRVSGALSTLLLAILVCFQNQYTGAIAYGETTCDSLLRPDTTGDRDGGEVFGSAKFVGLASCSLSNCHRGDRGTVGAEFSIWVRDPHSMAFNSLRTDTAMLMTKGLHIKEPPHEAARCLACHAVATSPDRLAKGFALSEGVSCEVCHGAAEHWLGPHVRDDWKNLTAIQKTDYGMRDTKSLYGRTQMCAECHVGSDGRIVDHDLIAVGHPPLMFEMTAYHDSLPKHWNPKRDTSQDPAHKALMWLMGQAVTPRLQLESVTLNEQSLGFSEFSLFDCFSCHANLRPTIGPSTANNVDTSQGGAAWGNWTVSLFKSMNAQSQLFSDQASAGVIAIRQEVQLTQNNAAKARHTVLDGLRSLHILGETTENVRLSLTQLSSLLIAVSHVDTQQARLDWYSAWQRYLGLRAIYLSKLQLEAVKCGTPARDIRLERQLQELRALLTFPPNYSSPVDFDPQQIQSIFNAIHKHVAHLPTMPVR